MSRHTLVLALLGAPLLSGCFTDPGPASSSEASSGEDSTSSTDDGTTTGPEPDLGDGEETDTTDAGDATDETGEPLLPEPRLLWLLDGNFLEEIDGAHAMTLGEVGFENALHDQGARVNDGGFIDASAGGPLVLQALDGFSVRIVFRIEDPAPKQGLWSLGREDTGDVAVHNFFFLWFHEQKLRLTTEVGAGENHFVDLAPAPATGEWHTLVAVFDAGEAMVYWDGEVRGGGSYVEAETATTELYLGSIRDDLSPASTLALRGVLDEVAFYDVVLSEAEALALSE